jgi:hypothetical protein
MSRQIAITTLSTARGDSDFCYDRETCPGVHTLADRPGRLYCIVTEVTDPEQLPEFGALLEPGQTLGTIPRFVIDQMPLTYTRDTLPWTYTVAAHPDLIYCVVTVVTDRDELDAFASLMGYGEVLCIAPIMAKEVTPL